MQPKAAAEDPRRLQNTKQTRGTLKNVISIYFVELL